MSDERTEAPTQRRLDELSARGSTARSQDLVSTLALLAAIVGLQQVAPMAMSQATAGLRTSLIRAGSATFTTSDVASLFLPMGMAAAAVLAGVAVPAATVALASGLFQIRGKLAFGAISPDPSRMNPLAGLGRMFGMQGLVGLIWPILKVVVVVLVLQGSARSIVETLPTAISGGFNTQVQVLGGAFLDTARNGAAALLGLAVVDVIYRRWQFMRQARMSRKEIKDEMRQNDGDPAIRARIRAMQRRIAKNRMMHRVPEAKVVVVNPTHFAVALAYDSKDMPAPEVVAKGADLIAQKIIEIAREHGVPVVPSPPLARALFRSVEVGQPIPSSLYEAVAEILAYVFTVRRRS